MNMQSVGTALGLSSLIALCMAASAMAQDVNIRSEASASSSSSVVVDGDGGSNVRVKSKASASTSVTVGAPPHMPLRTPAREPAREPAGGPAGGPAPAAAAPAPLATPFTAASPAFPADPSFPPQQVAPRPRPPAPCKKTVEVTDDGIRITVVNNYCAARIVNLFTWREGGKTHLQFEVDNSGGGAQAHLRMAERWSDARGRVIGDVIDEQRLAIEAKRNKVVVLTGPTPAAMTATITLYK